MKTTHATIQALTAVFALMITLTITAIAGNEGDSLRSTAFFNLDACYANINDGSNQDYNEFTAQIENGVSCSELEIIGGNLYREMSFFNTHSCTPGMGGSPAMCVSGDSGCNFNAGSQRSVRINVRVTPGASGTSSLSSIAFYEKAPSTYAWINGASGQNNYPTKFGIRVLKNGNEIYVSSGNATALDWTLRTFNFAGDPNFIVNEPTIFNIEFLAYCPIGNGSSVSAWDLEDITIASNCGAENVAGGFLEGGPFEFCVGDGEVDNVSGITLSNALGDNSQYVITDENGNILGLPPTPEVVDFDGAGAGICLIWHLSYSGNIEGLEVGNNIHTDLTGCLQFSNSISVVRNQPEGGILDGGPFEFCVGDGEADHVSGVSLSGNSGTNSRYVVTDTSGNILGLPPAPEAVNFDGAGAGVCLIWHLSYEDGLQGVEVGNNTDHLVGCFSFSNAITVIRNQPEGGILDGGPFEFCVGDGGRGPCFRCEPQWQFRYKLTLCRHRYIWQYSRTTTHAGSSRFRRSRSWSLSDLASEL